MSPRSRLAAVLVAASALLAAGAAPASASFHFMSIKEVFAGAPGNPQAQYVMLQMYSGGQQFVQGHSVRVYDAGGLQIGQFTFPANVADGSNQATILVATPQAASFFGITPDLAMTPVIAKAGGKVCFDSIDCVSWGSYSGSSAGTGNPESPAGGIPTNYALKRDASAGDPTLEAGDDTNDSAADFFVANPGPRTNLASGGTRGEGTVSGGVVTFTAAPGVADNVSLVQEDGSLIVRSTKRAIRSGNNTCFNQGATDLHCSGGTQAVLNVGDGADTASVTAPIPTTLNGAAGNDTLSGGPKDDILNGGTENDTLTGGFGADDLGGGANVDTVSYAARTGRVVVDLDAQKDDGSSFDQNADARRDWVKVDVENLTGGLGHDHLVGDGDANVFEGGQGADLILGGFGLDTATYAKRTTAVTVTLDQQANDGGPSDQKSGTTERDNLFVDNIIGGSAADSLTGNADPNVITGGGGTDTLSGLGSADELFAKDGKADSVTCGAGIDKLHRDAGLDTFPTSGAGACETVD